VPAGPSYVDEQWGEPLHPAIYGDVIHDHAALGQELLHIAVGETVAQVPAYRDHDDILRKSEPSKARSWC
jgi:hypothetical protein